MKRRIGIIGTGNVGKALARGLLQHDYEVMVGSRSAEKLVAMRSSIGERLSVGTPTQATAFADIVILAVKGTAALEAVVSVGADALAGKVVIDTTNPIADAPPANGVFQYFTGPNDSLMEQLQRAAPAACFVKAWNSVGNVHMIDPKFPDGRPTMFLCGNDATAKEVVAGILQEVGWEAADMGQVESARAIEHLGQLWCLPYLRSNRTNHAFKLLKA